MTVRALRVHHQLPPRRLAAARDEVERRRRERRAGGPAQERAGAQRLARREAPRRDRRRERVLELPLAELLGRAAHVRSRLAVGREHERRRRPRRRDGQRIQGLAPGEEQAAPGGGRRRRDGVGAERRERERRVERRRAGAGERRPVLGEQVRDRDLPAGRVGGRLDDLISGPESFTTVPAFGPTAGCFWQATRSASESVAATSRTVERPLIFNPPPRRTWRADLSVPRPFAQYHERDPAHIPWTAREVVEAAPRYDGRGPRPSST